MKQNIMFVFCFLSYHYEVLLLHMDCLFFLLTWVCCKFFFFQFLLWSTVITYRLYIVHSNNGLLWHFKKKKICFCFIIMKYCYYNICGLYNDILWMFFLTWVSYVSVLKFSIKSTKSVKGIMTGLSSFTSI